MQLSIVIPAYNEEEVLPRTLERIQAAVGAQRLPQSEWEIIVCDNNSDDRTAELASGLGARVVTEPHNQIARARNTGAAAASGKWLLFIDADTWPDEALMQDVLAIIGEDRLIGCGSTIKIEGGTLFNRLRMERINPVFRILNMSGGAFLLCRKDAFDAIGGFSENLYALEEVDLQFRLKKYGRSLHKGFKVLHAHPVATSGRKGEIRFSSILRMIVSNFMAIILFLLYFILPKKIIGKVGRKMLGYWYKR